MRQNPKIELLNCDCMEYMAGLTDKAFDLAIVDPPYRDDNQPTKDMRKNGSMISIQGRPKKKYWIELLRTTKEQIVWGANNFELPQWKGFIVWEKVTISENFTMSMAEIASLSGGLSTISKIFKFAPQGNKLDPRIHPTQKPVELYRWILKTYAKPGWKIFDSHLGSGSIACACWDMGFDLVGCEIDKDYYDAALERFRRHSQANFLF